MLLTEKWVRDITEIVHNDGTYDSDGTHILAHHYSVAGQHCTQYRTCYSENPYVAPLYGKAAQLVQ